MIFFLFLSFFFLIISLARALFFFYPQRGTSGGRSVVDVNLTDRRADEPTCRRQADEPTNERTALHLRTSRTLSRIYRCQTFLHRRSTRGLMLRGRRLAGLRASALARPIGAREPEANARAATSTRRCHVNRMPQNKTNSWLTELLSDGLLYSSRSSAAIGRALRRFVLLLRFRTLALSAPRRHRAPFVTNFSICRLLRRPVTPCVIQLVDGFRYLPASATLHYDIFPAGSLGAGTAVTVIYCTNVKCSFF